MCKKIYCIELDCFFETIAEASKQSGVHKNGINRCCLGSCKSAGKHPITGEKLHWIYADDFHDKNRFEQYCSVHFSCHRGHQVRCIELNKTFGSIIDASRQTGVDRHSIQHCCDDHRYSAGKHPETNAKLHWRYVD